MAFEIVHLIKRVELFVQTVGPGTFTLSTDQPGDAMAIRFSAPFDTEITTSRRRTIRWSCPPTTKGKLLQASIRATTSCILYGGRVLARPLGVPGVSGWTWYPLPVRLTEESYQVAPLPIRPTAEMYQDAPLPIRPTAELYRDAPLPIRATPEAYSRGPLPLPETSPIAKWIPIPVDRVQ